MRGLTLAKDSRKIVHLKIQLALLDAVLQAQSELENLEERWRQDKDSLSDEDCSKWIWLSINLRYMTTIVEPISLRTGALKGLKGSTEMLQRYYKIGNELKNLEGKIMDDYNCTTGIKHAVEWKTSNDNPIGKGWFLTREAGTIEQIISKFWLTMGIARSA